MDLRSDFPYWTVKNGLVRAYPALTEDARCDAIVVGGGITGALLAHSLCEAGIDTMVADRRDIGHGSTSASTALLQYEIDKPLHELEQCIGRCAAERAYRLGGEAIERLSALAGTSAEFTRCPSLFVAKNARHIPFLRREFAARRRAGLSVTLLEARDLVHRVGIDRPLAIRSSVSASVDPYRLTHNLFGRWLGRGLRVFDRTTVLRYHALRAGVVAEIQSGTARARVRARRIFFASGFESQDILRERIVRLRSTYALVSEPTEAPWWKSNCLIWETGDPYLYARQTSDGRIMVGGEDDNIVAPARRDRQTQAKALAIVRKFHRLFPGSQIEPAFWWSGVFASTRDGLPYIGCHPSSPTRRLLWALAATGSRLVRWLPPFSRTVCWAGQIGILPYFDSDVRLTATAVVRATLGLPRSYSWAARTAGDRSCRPRARAGQAAFPSRCRAVDRHRDRTACAATVPPSVTVVFVTAATPPIRHKPLELRLRPQPPQGIALLTDRRYPVYGYQALRVHQRKNGRPPRAARAKMERANPSISFIPLHRPPAADPSGTRPSAAHPRVTVTHT